MRRLRLIFALVAVAVLVPLGLLIQRALASAEAELAFERRAVAERVIDEMERELTAFLRREEDRPFFHYRFLARPDLGLANAPEGGDYVKSPLAEPLESFVIGSFQLAPDGTLSTPLLPDDPRLARLLTGWREDAAVRARAEAMLATVRTALAARLRLAGEPGEAPLARPADEKSAAGSEVAGSDKAGEKNQRAGTTVEMSKQLTKETAAESGAGPLEVLEKLNRGASQRLNRVSKTSQTQAANVATLAADPAARLRQEAQPAVVDLRLEPMVGRAAGEDAMLLYRTVLAGASAYRQGLLIDRGKLVAWLAEKALGNTAGKAGELRISAAKEGEEAAPGTAIFRHRFAEPFAPVIALVEVEGAGGGGLRTARQLSALLLVATLLGLAAVYRMAAYAVAYAQRRSDFVAAVTHELKTPLTAIRMYGEMLRDGMVEDEARKNKYYRTIVAEGERLSRLVDNVLELGRLERKEKRKQAAAGNAGAILQEAVALLQPHAEKEGFTLALEVEEGLPAVEVDRDALLQVIFNLVDNAIKYAQGAADKKVIVRAKKEGQAVVVEVEDRGPGVAPKQLRKIFEPFWRGENELTRSTKGTGIGLALVRGLAERMGGEVSARNVEQGGLAVTIRFLSVTA